MNYFIKNQEKRKDDLELNAALRKKFRTEKKVIEKQLAIEAQPKNFALPLAPADAEDRVFK